MEPDFFFFKEKEKNVEKLLKDCDFQEVDLNDDGKTEIIVKVNWRSEGNDGFPKGRSFVRGTQDQGRWHIYNVTNGAIDYLGTMTDGNKWIPLATKSYGYKDIETWAHESYDKYLIDRYEFSNGKYYKVSSILYELKEDGTKHRKLKIYK